MTALSVNTQYEGLETIQDFIRWGASLFSEANLFFGHGTDNALEEARLLVLHAIHQPNTLAIDLFNSRLTFVERQRVADIFIQRIETRKPAAYLIGEAWFAGLPFYVNESVLVPRSPIAELIEQAYAPWISKPEKVTRVLDMCTGSGCIGIASLQAFENAQVDLVDISPEALAVAQKNIQRYDLEGVATAIESDLFNGLDEQKYDLIVSNPPYVDKIEMDHLPEEFQQEPRLGLEAGEDGLDLVRIILQQAAHYLTEEGVLIVEVGVSQYFVEQEYSELPLYWFEFERGGEGVFAITRSELEVFQEYLDERVG